MDKRVKEALELAQHARKTGLSKDKFKQVKIRFYAMYASFSVQFVHCFEL